MDKSPVKKKTVNSKQVMEDMLQEIAKDHVALGNKIYQLKMFMEKVNNGKFDDSDLLEFDDPFLEGVAHG